MKTRKSLVFLASGAGLVALMLGAAASTLSGIGLLPQVKLPPASPFGAVPELAKSEVLPLVSKTPDERAEKLHAIAQNQPSQDKLRARYLLAVDFIQKDRGGAALPLLAGLDREYPLLAPHILAKRAQAETATGDSGKAQATWKELLQRFPDSPVAAEAMFNLGRQERQYWEEAIAKFPAHPRSVQIAQTLLQENPNQPQLLLVLAKYGLYLPDIEGVLDRLTTEYAGELTPEDWQAVGFAYWENLRYDSAGKAYARAPQTPLNLFRAGRGAHIGERTKDAIASYQLLIQTFPEAPETATALIRLAQIAKLPQERIAALDQVIAQFPDRAGEAMVKKAELLEKQGNAQMASQVRQALLSQQGMSDAAAELRWSLAEKRAEAGDIKGAWELAKQIGEQNPDSPQAPEAAFWIGKWAQMAGQEKESKQAYEYVLTHYPQSYYAWRSAVMLGWDVGDFTTVRQKLPQVVKPAQRAVPPAGSDVLKELYRLGQDWDAWAQWQTEFENPVQPSVGEQFTDGLMRLGVGDNLDGIFMVSSLAWRDQPEEKAAYKELKQQPTYWQALYPFPFKDTIEQWSQQRQLNPVLVTALIRQESRFEPNIKSSVGATGLMQVMPETAEWIASKINLKSYDLSKPEDSVKLGTWYLDYTHQEYANNSLLAVASYNAGPGAVAEWVQRFSMGDPDWFVEQIPFPETKGYVESVFENYWNYLRLYNPEISKQLAQASSKHVDAIAN